MTYEILEKLLSKKFDKSKFKQSSDQKLLSIFDLMVKYRNPTCPQDILLTNPVACNFRFKSSVRPRIFKKLCLIDENYILKKNQPFLLINLPRRKG